MKQFYLGMATGCILGISVVYTTAELQPNPSAWKEAYQAEQQSFDCDAEFVNLTVQQVERLEMCETDQECHDSAIHLGISPECVD